MRHSFRLIRALATAGCIALALPAIAQPGSGCDYGMGAWGWGAGPGMMGGWGMGQGGWGMGPGMMGGWGGGGGGPGMMGGGGGGPGMMGGGGPGYGMGPGMSGRGPDALGLNADQRAKILQMQKDLRSKHWGLMGKLMEARFRLQELYDADTLDKAAIDAQYKEIDAARRQMIESSIEARNQMRAVLTKEQLDKFDTWSRGYGPGPMRRGN